MHTTRREICSRNCSSDDYVELFHGAKLVKIKRISERHDGSVGAKMVKVRVGSRTEHVHYATRLNTPSFFSLLCFYRAVYFGTGYDYVS